MAKLLRLLSTFLVGCIVVCNAFPQNEIDDDVAARYGIQSGNQQSQNHVVPDRSPALNPGPGCRIEYETKYEIVEEESTRQECRRWVENKCTTRQRPKCSKYTDTVCDTKYRNQCRNWSEQECKDTWRNECSTKYREECNDHSRPIQVPYEEDECTSRKERRCEKHWEEPIKGKKVWVDNPATCKYFDATDCRPVTKYRTEQERYTTCDQVPYEHCDRVKDTNCYQVPKQECKDVPYQDCYDVPKEKCVQESYQDCQDYPRQECKDVHSKVPKQVAKQIPIRVCGDRRELYNAEPSFDGSGIFDVRSDGDEHDPEDDVETIAFGQQKEKIDPGLFSQQTEDTISIIKKGNANVASNEDDEVGFVFSDK